MKFYIITAKKNSSSSSNVLAYENRLSDAIQSINRYGWTNSMIKDAVSQIKSNEKVSSISNLSYLVLDDDRFSIPQETSILLVSINGEPHKFFGNYMSYVIGLFAEDWGVSKSSVQDILNNAENYGDDEKTLTSYGNSIKISAKYIANQFL